jgi:hypothetical protein
MYLYLFPSGSRLAERPCLPEGSSCDVLSAVLGGKSVSWGQSTGTAATSMMPPLCLRGGQILITTPELHVPKISSAQVGAVVAESGLFQTRPLWLVYLQRCPLRRDGQPCCFDLPISVFTLLRLLPMSDQDKDVEILVLFQQITASRVFFFVIVCINICNYVLICCGFPDVWQTASAPLGRSADTVGCFTDGHGQGPPSRNRPRPPEPRPHRPCPHQHPPARMEFSAGTTSAEGSCWTRGPGTSPAIADVSSEREAVRLRPSRVPLPLGELVPTAR